MTGAKYSALHNGNSALDSCIYEWTVDLLFVECVTKLIEERRKFRLGTMMGRASMSTTRRSSLSERGRRGARSSACFGTSKGFTAEGPRCNAAGSVEAVELRLAAAG